MNNIYIYTKQEKNVASSGGRWTSPAWMLIMKLRTSCNTNTTGSIHITNVSDNRNSSNLIDRWTSPACIIIMIIIISCII